MEVHVDEQNNFTHYFGLLNIETLKLLNFTIETAVNEFVIKIILECGISYFCFLKRE